MKQAERRPRGRLPVVPFLVAVLTTGPLGCQSSSSSGDVPAASASAAPSATVPAGEVDEAVCTVNGCVVGYIGDKAAATLAEPKNAKLAVKMDADTPAHLATLPNAPGITRLYLGLGAPRYVAVTSLAPVDKLTNLVDLQMWEDDLPDLTSLAGLEHLERLQLDHGHKLTSLAGIETLVHLKSLTFTAAHVTNLGPIGDLPELKELTVEHGNALDLTALAKLAKLRSLQLGQINGTSLAPVGALTGLTLLRFSGTKYTDVEALAKLTALQEIALPDEITAGAFLTPMKDLRVANLSGQRKLVDLAPLSGLTSLTHLQLSHTGVKDLAPLRALTALEWLDVNGTAVSDIGVLAAFPHLVRLRIDRTKVKSLAVLAGVKSLKDVDVSGLDGVDLTPLMKLPHLNTLRISAKQVSEEALAAFKAAQPHVRMATSEP